MGVHTYIGARYVPRFMGTYDPTQIYEALDVVENGTGTSYIARINVPAGTPLTDTTYWFLYGSTSGAIVNLQHQIDAINDILNSYKKYETMSDVIANVANLDAGDIVETTGFYNISDGGAGLYLITNIVRSDMFCIDITGGLYAALIDSYDDVNILKCGVHEGPAVTQAEAEANTDIINDLLDVIYTVHPTTVQTNGKYRGGGSIYFPIGIYRIGKKITGFDGKINLTIHGDDGMATKITPYSGVSIPFIETASTFSITLCLCVHDLQISGFTEGVKIENGVSCEIFNCLFEGCTDGISLDSFVDMHIHDNQCINSANGLHIYTAQSNSTTLYYERNYCAHNTGNCVYIQGGANGYRTFYFNENIFEYTPYGIYAVSSATHSRIYVSDNHFEQCTSFAIRVDGVGLRLKNNEIDTNIAIANPNGQLIDLDNFTQAFGGVSLNNNKLKLKWYKTNGEFTDTVLNKFRVNAKTLTLGTYPHRGSGATNYYKITYTSSTGIYSCVGTWIDGTQAFTPVSSSVISSGISAPSTNAGGTVAFTDASGLNPKIDLEYYGEAAPG